METKYYQKLIGGRIAYIDFAKCIAIWLVLWGHVITQMMYHELNENPVYIFIYFSHAFIYVSKWFLCAIFIPTTDYKISHKEIQTTYLACFDFRDFMVWTGMGIGKPNFFT